MHLEVILPLLTSSEEIYHISTALDSNQILERPISNEQKNKLAKLWEIAKYSRIHVGEKKRFGNQTTTTRFLCFTDEGTVSVKR